jgi:23S rRNA U2552 (ribose-2'-O)-methylase RlmE/FtsJ
METILLKRNELNEFHFKNEVLFEIKDYTVFLLKNERYGNFKDLDDTKARLDLLDKNVEKYRRAAAKYLHEYELVKMLCKKQVISRAYFKLYEIIYFDPLIIKENLSCFFMCEAPGGFIECVSDIRRKKNLQTKYISISKFDSLIKYDNYLESNNLIYSDITENTNENIKTVLDRFPNGVDLITADGGFDIKQFNAQELLSSKLLLCEIYIAIKTQKLGGTFIIKFFDMFSHNSIMYYHILSTFYSYVKIIKPQTSRNCNSERYLVCYNFKGINFISTHLKSIIDNFVLTDTKFTLIYPEFNVSDTFSKKIATFNNLILHEQIKTINESIRMVQNRNMYFQNLLLTIFLEQKICNFNFLKQKSFRLENIVFFKNILESRIKKCINFLRMYNINIHNIF